jgi:hypothetical protein
VKRFYQLDSKDAPNIHKMLSDEEDRLRSVLLNRIIQSPGVVSSLELGNLADDTGINVSSAIKGLKQKGLAVVRDDGAVAGVYPFSASPTTHQVQFEDGKSTYAMCAIDSLGIAYELEKDVVISSSCSHCKRPISIEITEGEISMAEPQTTLALHVSLGNYKDWAGTC